MAHAQPTRDDHIAKELEHGFCAGSLLRKRLIEHGRPFGAQCGPVGAFETVELPERGEQ